MKSVRKIKRRHAMFQRLGLTISVVVSFLMVPVALLGVLYFSACLAATQNVFIVGSLLSTLILLCMVLWLSMFSLIKTTA